MSPARRLVSTVPRRVLLALLSGAVIPSSLSPMDVWPAGILGIMGLYLALDGLGARAAALTGWSFGLGLFGAGSSWVWVSIATYGNVGPFLSVLVTLLFVAAMALFPALHCGLMQRFFSPRTTPLVFSAFWLLGEWLRSWLFTGFPWLYLGYAHIHSPLAPLAPVFGVLGIGFVVALAGSTACHVVLEADEVKRPFHETWRWLLKRTAPLLATLALTLGLMFPDWVRPLDQPPLTAGIVHGTIPQEEKFDSSLRLSHVEYFEAGTDPLWGHDIILWPETAIAFYHHRAIPLLEYLDERAREAGSTLISGIFHAGETHVHNSILALGQGSGLYHKQKLVPFGEYVPLQGLFGPVFRIFDLPMSTIGPGPTGQQGLLAGEQRIAPFICYEIVYPDFVRRHARDADLLITISNDTWFGSSWGPRQHLQMAAMRALENGRYLLRSTNNGLSAIIDERGRILSRSTQFDPQVLSEEVRLFEGRTPFSHWGSWPVVLFSLSVLAAAAAAARRKN